MAGREPQLGQGGSGAERRRTARVTLHMPLTVRIAGRQQGSEHRCLAELLDAGLDGRGAALMLPSDSQVPVGAAITLLSEGYPDIAGIVVSRLGMRARFRVGVRVDLASQAELRALLERMG